ncbi:F-box protein At4g18380-like isoform X1 [Lycium ferocissimum]|uniref:F-box protein At4g18380-like isoform X1 n=1 Tax=Lycium ferocissimum TaxID=112874 RepID=UPI00281638F0|nr:F-box protein At4g18380-like isoform X1 [Lycium ferocissimum]
MSIIEEMEDFFDLLPDAIVLSIFDKVQDAKSLCISSSLCKRFHFLVTQTQYISLTIPPQKSHKSSPNNNTNRNQFIGFLNRVFVKPFQFILQQITKWNPLCMPLILSTKKNDKYNCCTCSYASPTEILRNFNEIKELEIRLPSPASKNTAGTNNAGGALLKWKAEFGSQLKNCLIVGGTSLSPIQNKRIREEDDVESVDIRRRDDPTSIELQRMTNDELKLRIVWIISSLMAASSRHCLLEDTIKEKKTINNVVITDDVGQGKCCIYGEQVEEMRRNNTEGFSTKMPALKVKMWCVPELELHAEGCVMKGATLVVIKPVDEWSKADEGRDLVAKGFGFAGEGKEEKVFDEVARELVKLERSYSLEMNSF